MGIDVEMLVKTRCNPTEEQIKDWSWRLAGAFYKEPFYKFPCLEKVDIWYQDGPEVEPAEDETFLKVALSGRYYGIGYERGPLPQYLTIVSFLQTMIPQSEIWYGGDSSGVCIEHFNREFGEKLWRHFVNEGHLKYVKYFSNEVTPTCPLCNKPMITNTWGGNKVGHYCYGCNNTAVTQKDKTYFNVNFETLEPIKQ